MLEVLGDTLEPQRVVAGRYRLERPLGEGGMGVVWAAREIRTNRPFALKFLRAARGAEPKNLARFAREARTAMAVSHPNVAKVYAVLHTPCGLPFLVMDLLEGESLRSLLTRRPRLGISECARVFVPIVRAVEAAHAIGIVHRDLKPDNVFLVGGHEVRVIDFGIAKQMPAGDATVSVSLTSTGALLGTPHYMAPEQIFGDADLDGRADVWALGVMLYECLAGVRPIEGIGFGPLIRRITADPIPPLHSKQSGLPTEISRLVDRMLSRTRDDRPTLAEVRDTLVRGASGETLVVGFSQDIGSLPPSTTVGVASKLPSLDSRSTKAGRRWPAMVAFVTIATLGVGGTVAAERLHRGRSVVGPVDTASSSWPAISESPPPSRSASAETSAPTPLKAETSATASPTAAEYALRARSAFDRRDGKGCLRAYDAHDRLESNPAHRSTDPQALASIGRAMCLMVAGDCNGGRALYRAYRARHSSGSSEAELEGATDAMAAKMCTVAP